MTDSTAKIRSGAVAAVLGISDHDWSEIRTEIRHLYAVYQWAEKQTGLHAGARVRITKPQDCSTGWKPYAETLAVGATAVVQELSFNQFRDRWDARVKLDREWAVHGDAWSKERRYWHGPADLLPDGYLQGDPDGSVFYLKVTDLELIAADALGVTE